MVTSQSDIVMPRERLKQQSIRCSAVSRESGLQCKNKACRDQEHCSIHIKHECTICLQEIGRVSTDKVVLTCNHRFHKHCMLQWLSTPVAALQHTCPLCRKNVHAYLLESIKPDYIDSILEGNFEFKEKIVKFTVKDKTVKFTLPMSTEQLDAIKHIIKVIEETTRAAEADLLDPPLDEIEKPHHIHRRRELVVPTSNASSLALFLPRSERQMLALKEMHQAMTAMQATAEQELEMAKYQFRDQLYRNSYQSEYVEKSPGGYPQ